MLLHLNLLEELTQGSTVARTVLSADTDLLGAASLQIKADVRSMNGLAAQHLFVRS